MENTTQQERDNLEIEIQNIEGHNEYIQTLKDKQDKEINEYMQHNQNKEVLETVKNINKIQAKKYITTKEMEDIYNISVSSQKDYRGRLNDPLPFNQKVFRGKITYTVEDIEKWLKNQNK